MLKYFCDINDICWSYFAIFDLFSGSSMHKVFYIYNFVSNCFPVLEVQIKRSQHACINPAITIILQMGSGGHGVPPLKGPDGKTFVSRRLNLIC